ncbi:ABC transporter ATP-binding protein [Ancylobacter dichloromethanicus]|uniref:Spermidine/putrescine import ATP-binding protein PotA n=1 Tax=Ancylobacter dichloromethanicus TaxID=518825 RepID=A0A9W6MZM4_9HYPH|nr:ABC transporter ATP-binding protein [Ancylobacter dichloromethanicus]MBS7552796.1 ABC transporter ATP-binding protein [Ancylobacter dichloromethanicus]GLK72160.1 polyamine-transporting ATPase [Ancylobacter dichloromethanicus]
MNDAFVTFEKVRKTYDGRTLVVSDLDLVIARGEFLTMLGPSGSGKTTCLMMLAGFERPTAGRITLGGRPIDGVPPHKRDIGVVFQNYALFPHMTVVENVAFPLSVRKLSAAAADRKARAALGMVHLQHLADRRPSQLSGGQQQRVALARALVFEPVLILMDEPLGALDKQLREAMQYEIKHLHERLGVTIVYVTHDQSEALTMSDRVAVFNEGRIQQLSTPKELYERPQNAFVAGFIGENNRVDGTLKRLAGGDCEVETAAGPLRCEAIGDRSPGARKLISIRPERVRIVADGAAYANVMPARVEEVIYHGDHLRLRLSTMKVDDFIAKVPNAESGHSFAAGQELRIGFNTADCLALDAPG